MDRKTNIEMAQNAFALSGAAGAPVQIGLNILNNRVRRVYKMIVSNLAGAGGILTVWQGDAAVPARTRKYDITMIAGGTSELGMDFDEPLITARPTTSTIAVAVQNNQIYLEGNGGAGQFSVTMCYCDTRG